MESPVSSKDVGMHITAWRQSLVLAVQEWNYKEVAFKDKITTSTNVVDGLDILIASPLLSEKEKAAFSGLRASLVKLLTQSSRMTSVDLLVELIPSTEQVTNIFDEDRKKQGQYVPPMMAQSIGGDGKVKKTFEIGDDGNIKTKKGGEFGVVPSATEDEKQMQREHIHHPGLRTEFDPTKLSQKERENLLANLRSMLGKDGVNGKDGKNSN